MSHLTEEQFADLLAGEATDGETQAHLAACVTCRQEVESIGSAFRSFHDLSLTWAQIQAPRLVQTPSRVSLLLGGRPLWGLGFATAMAAGVIAFSLHTPVRSAETEPAAQVSVAATADTTLAADNKLMASIDEEIRYRPQPAVPLRELRLSTRRAERQQPMSVAN